MKKHIVTPEEQKALIKLEIINCFQNAVNFTNDPIKSAKATDAFINARIKSHPEQKDLVVKAAEEFTKELADRLAATELIVG